MIKNSDLFYSRAKEYQSKRKGVMDAYEKRIADLEKAKGSQLYVEETEKAAKTRDDAITALKEEYGGYFRISLDAMSEANNSRGVTPPTADQLAILQALKMRDSVTQKELDRAANSCTDNAMAISVINEIAKKNGFLRGYHCTTGEMGIEDADGIINNLKAAVNDFMTYDTSRGARAAAQHHANIYGTTGEERPLAKRPLFDSKEGCYDTILPFGMNKDTLNAFCAAVDGE